MTDTLTLADGRTLETDTPTEGLWPFLTAEVRARERAKALNELIGTIVADALHYLTSGDYTEEEGQDLAVKKLRECPPGYDEYTLVLCRAEQAEADRDQWHEAAMRETVRAEQNEDRAEALQRRLDALVGAVRREMQISGSWSDLVAGLDDALEREKGETP
jgi:hypothetical protein